MPSLVDHGEANMRATERRALEQPFAPGDGVDTGIARALGALAPSVRRLYQEIFRDLDEYPAFGVRWWITYPLGSIRRTLISHYLLECVHSVQIILVDAALVLYE